MHALRSILLLVVAVAAVTAQQQVIQNVLKNNKCLTRLSKALPGSDDEFRSIAGTCIKNLRVYSSQVTQKQAETLVTRCFGVQYGLISRNGQLNKDKLREMIGQANIGDAEKERYYRTVDTCNKFESCLREVCN